MERRRVAVAGGGTAGHVYPALAIAAAYRQTVDNVDLLFLGTAEGFEARLMPRHGYRLVLVQGAPLFRVGLGGKLRALNCLGSGIGQARRALKAHGARLVIGLGGYASAGVLLAARSLGLPAAIHEANVLPGLTNKLLGRLVDRVYLGFAASGWAFPRGRTLVTGNPVRSEIVRVGCEKQQRRYGVDRPVHILVTGGSEGAPFLNRHAPDLLRRVAGHGLALAVSHQVGVWAVEPVRAAYARAGLAASVVPYIEDMATAYRRADLVVARAGALTLAELAVCGLPALLVPLPTAARDHQTANARVFAAAGGSWWVREADWHPESLAARLAALLRDPAAWMAAALRMRQLATPHAARAIVADCEALMAGRW
jgi:UDP-N-acetylglucosamine--N-acetylmuramyl-(pentapeptide) pyrophosphoryl-undecaprenol N-acetylglucosamine transferase